MTQGQIIKCPVALLQPLVQYKQYNLMDNQFISSPLLVRRDPPSVDPRDEVIKGLQNKNQKLKVELQRIQRAVEEKFDELDQEEGPRKRESIFYDSENLEILNKQLANTYKRIKMYEYQIGKLEESGRNQNVSQKTVQLQQIIKEKKALADKLKHQYTRDQKTLHDNTNKLVNQNQKEELESYMKKITEEAKFFKEKIKSLEEKDKLKGEAMKKQFQVIKKMENTLLESGMSGHQLQDMKKRAVKGNGARKDATVKGSVELKEEEEEQIEDRTQQHYEMLLADVGVLEKMRAQHHKQLMVAEEEKQEAIRKNMTSRNKLLECENQIQNLEKEIQVMKTRVVPSNMKPLRPIRSYSSHQPTNQSKILPSKSARINNKSMTHLLKFDEVGAFTMKGQRFSDRTILGKHNLTSKITAVRVYLDARTRLFSGIQCTYGGKKGGDHMKKEKEAKDKVYIEEEFQCKPRTYIKSISGTMSLNERIESVMFTSSDGSSHRFGEAKTPQKHFSLDIGSDEFPVCVYGSLMITKEPGKRETCELEFMGFEIQNQSALNKSPQLNEFILE